MTSITRRSAIVGLSAAAAMSRFGTTSAQAQSNELIVANWGGSYGGFAEASFEKPILEKKGLKIVHDYQEVPERITKVLAESRLPRGRISVLHAGDFNSALLGQQGALADVSEAEVPNLSSTMKELRSRYFVPWIYVPYVILYNPKFITTPPQSFAELWDEKYAGKLGLMDHIFHNHIQMASVVAGGSAMADAKGKPALLDLKKRVNPKIYPGQDTLVAAFKNEEIWLATGYKGRALLWAESGLPINYVYPKEGGVAQILGASVTKKAPNLSGAYEYVNAMIDKSALATMVKSSFYCPSVPNAPVDEALLKRVDLSEDEKKRLQIADPVYTANSFPDWLQWWNRDFKAT